MYTSQISFEINTNKRFEAIILRKLHRVKKKENQNFTAILNWVG